MIRFEVLVIILTMSLISKAMAATQSTATDGNDQIVLENSRVALNIGSNDGAIRSMYDKSLDIYFEFEGLAFEISTKKGTLKGLVPEDVQRSSERITLNFETPDFIIDLVYSLGAKNGFAEKWIEIREKNNEGYFIKDVILENTSLDKQFKEIYIKESDIVMALCDQWWNPDKSDINKSRYLMLPIHMDPQTGEPKMTFHKKWNPLLPAE